MSHEETLNLRINPATRREIAEALRRTGHVVDAAVEAGLGAIRQAEAEWSQQREKNARRRARRKCKQIEAEVNLAIENDGILTKWKPREIEQVRTDMTLFAAKTDTNDHDVEQAKEVLSRLSTLRTEAYAMEEQERLQTTLVNRLANTLSELGFNVYEASDSTAKPGRQKVIAASKQTGEAFGAVIRIDGSAQFEFDGYTNQACHVDAQNIEAVLAAKYGIQTHNKHITLKDDGCTPGAAAAILPNTRHQKGLQAGELGI